MSMTQRLDTIGRFGIGSVEYHNEKGGGKIGKGNHVRVGGTWDVFRDEQWRSDPGEIPDCVPYSLVTFFSVAWFAFGGSVVHLGRCFLGLSSSVTREECRDSSHCKDI